MVSVKTKVRTVAEIARLLDHLVEKFDDDAEGDAERDYLVAHCPDRLHATIRELPTLSLHLLARIPDSDEGVSVVGLAAAAGQLKGTVSKHVQRLHDAGLVQRTPVPGNRKEIRLRPTADGALLVEVHREMHQEMSAGLRDFFLRYTAAELDTVTRVLTDLVRAEKRGVRWVPAAERSAGTA